MKPHFYRRAGRWYVRYIRPESIIARAGTESWMRHVLERLMRRPVIGSQYEPASDTWLMT